MPANVARAPRQPVPERLSSTSRVSGACSQYSAASQRYALANSPNAKAPAKSQPPTKPAWGPRPEAMYA